MVIFRTEDLEFLRPEIPEWGGITIAWISFDRFEIVPKNLYLLDVIRVHTLFVERAATDQMQRSASLGVEW